MDDVGVWFLMRHVLLDLRQKVGLDQSLMHKHLALRELQAKALASERLEATLASGRPRESKHFGRRTAMELSFSSSVWPDGDRVRPSQRWYGEDRRHQWRSFGHPADVLVSATA